MALKIVAFGLVAHENAYLRNPWNVLDACVVTSSILVLAISSKEAEFLRVLRSMRPLRVVSRSGGMKVVVGALLHSIPPMGNVLLVCLLFWFIFGILGVQVFKGKLYRCVKREREKIYRKARWGGVLIYLSETHKFK